MSNSLWAWNLRTTEMSELSAVKAVLLDINGTVFPADAAAGVFEKFGLDTSSIPVSIQHCSSHNQGNPYQPML